MSEDASRFSPRQNSGHILPKDTRAKGFGCGGRSFSTASPTAFAANFPTSLLYYIRMKEIVVMVFVCCFLPSLVCAQPDVRFSELNHDFAAIGQQDEVVHVFTVTNMGDRDLVIRKLTAS